MTKKMTTLCLLCLKIISGHYQVRFHFELIWTWVVLLNYFLFRWVLVFGDLLTVKMTKKMTTLCLLCLKIISGHYQVRFHFELIWTWVLLLNYFLFIFNLVLIRIHKTTLFWLYNLMRTLWKPSKYDNGLPDVEETPKPWNVFHNARRVLSETAVEGCVKKCNKIQTVESPPNWKKHENTVKFRK